LFVPANEEEEEADEEEDDNDDVDADDEEEEEGVNAGLAVGVMAEVVLMRSILVDLDCILSTFRANLDNKDW
jgi:hypothetical protein